LFDRRKKIEEEMLTLQSSNLNENQLAEIAMAIQNRWGAATFVKMHEIVVVDDDEDSPVTTQGRSMDEDFEFGFRIIMDRLHMQRAFRLERSGKSKYRLVRIEGEPLPEWLEDAGKGPTIPEGYMQCAHCGKLFDDELLLSMHTKLHYIL
jgi:hypothetical protein